MNTNDSIITLPHRADARRASVAATEALASQSRLACEIRGGSPSSLTKSELAQLYFPGALRRLTRRQVMIIFEYLGEP